MRLLSSSRSSLFREPLPRFLLAGAALFAAYHWLGKPPPHTHRIVITGETRAALRTEHRQLTGRDPSAEEEQALLDRYIDNEVLVREAIARGLDRDDVIVRRRLIQKMEFLNQDRDPIPDPGEDQLRAYFDEHAQRYAQPERLSLVHVFLAGRRDDGAAILAGWREQLAAGADRATLGEPFVRGHDFRLLNRREVEEIFGRNFADAVFSLPAGEWSAPIASSFGLHLVRVDERRPERRPALDEVRDRVRADWREERRGAANRAATRRLRERYEVVVE